VRPDTATITVDGQDVTIDLAWNKASGACRGRLTWRGEHLDTGWQGSQRMVTTRMSKLVNQANERAAAEAVEREKLERWNAGQPKAVISEPKRPNT
jgi:hypothetical protein